MNKSRHTTYPYIYMTSMLVSFSAFFKGKKVPSFREFDSFNANGLLLLSCTWAPKTAKKNPTFTRWLISFFFHYFRSFSLFVFKYIYKTYGSMVTMHLLFSYCARLPLWRIKWHQILMKVEMKCEKCEIDENQQF